MAIFTDDFTDLSNWQVDADPNTSGTIVDNKLQNNILLAASPSSEVAEKFLTYTVEGLDDWFIQIEFDIIEFGVQANIHFYIKPTIPHPFEESGIWVISKPADFPELTLFPYSYGHTQLPEVTPAPLSGTLRIQNSGGDVTFSCNGTWGEDDPVTGLGVLNDENYTIYISTSTGSTPALITCDFDNFILNSELIFLEIAALSALELQAESINIDAVRLEIATLSTLELQAESINPDAIRLEIAALAALELQAEIVNPDFVILEIAALAALELQAEIVNPDIVILEIATLSALELQAPNPGPYELRIATLAALELQADSIDPNAVILEIALEEALKLQAESTNPNAVILETANVLALSITAGQEIYDANLRIRLDLSVNIRTASIIFAQLEIGLSGSLELESFFIKQATLEVASNLALELSAVKPLAGILKIGIIGSSKLTAVLAPSADLKIGLSQANELTSYKLQFAELHIALSLSLVLTVGCIGLCDPCIIQSYNSTGNY